MMMDAVTLLSAGLVKAAVSQWLRRRDDEPDVPVGDIIDAEVVDSRDRQQVRQELAQIEDVVRERLQADAESTDALSEADRERVVRAVADCFERARVTEHDFELAARDSVVLAGIVESRNLAFLSATNFSPVVADFFLETLIGACGVLIAVSAAGPVSHQYALASLLRDPGEVGAAVRRSIDAMTTPARTSDSSRGRTLYLRTVVAALDRGELVGVTLSEPTRQFRLSGIYTPPNVLVADTEMPADLALADSRRIHVVGVAGSGKTTLLRRLAVACARDALPEPLHHLRGLLPVYVSARRLELSEQSLNDPASALEDAMLPGLDRLFDRADLEHDLRAGRALLIIDGLDEVAEDDRLLCGRWLRLLVRRYADCRFVVSSRTGPVGEDTRIGPGFVSARVLPLDDSGITTLVGRWFQSAGEGERAEPLLDMIRRDAQLRDLVTLPLLCAVICAVFRDRGPRALQDGEIYEALLELMVERRDVERGLPAAGQLPRSLTLLFLEELSGFMVRNDIREWAKADAEEHVAHVIATMSRDLPSPAQVLRYLIDRSGVLIEPAPDVIGFLHLTFLEFLAARHFVNNDEIPLLIRNAHRPVWRQVVIMAAPKLRPRQCAYLLEALVAQVTGDRHHRAGLAALLQQCVAAAPRVDPQLRELIESTLQSARNWGDDVWTITVRDAGDRPDMVSLRELANWLRHSSLQRHGGVVIEEDAADCTLFAAGNLRLTALLTAVVEWREKTRADAPSTVTVSGERTVVTIAGAKT